MHIGRINSLGHNQTTYIVEKPILDGYCYSDVDIMCFMQGSDVFFFRLCRLQHKPQDVED
jgi:hypothetical protein